MRRLFLILASTLSWLPAAAAGGGGAADGNLLVTPQFGLVFWTLVTFILLLVVLGRFAWKPLLGALNERERSIQESLDNARTEREQAQKLLDEHRELVAQARRERSEAVAAGQRDAERLKAEILEEGRKQREQMLKQTEEQVKAEMRQARSELRGVAADLSVRVAEKLLAHNMDDAAQRKLVEDYLSELEGAPGGAPSGS